MHHLSHQARYRSGLVDARTSDIKSLRSGVREKSQAQKRNSIVELRASGFARAILILGLRYSPATNLESVKRTREWICTSDVEPSTNVEKILRQAQCNCPSLVLTRKPGDSEDL